MRKKMMALLNKGAMNPDALTLRELQLRALRDPKNTPKKTTLSHKRDGYEQYDNKERALRILDKIASGMTVTEASVSEGIKRLVFLSWIDEVPDLRERYRSAMKHQAAAMVDSVLIDGLAKDINEIDARIVGSKQKLVAWYAERIDPITWMEKKSYEFGGQITMQHTHELTQEQRERIATAWLMSRDTSLPGGKAVVTIEAEPVEITMMDQTTKALAVEPEVAPHAGDVVIAGVPATEEIKKKLRCASDRK